MKIEAKYKTEDGLVYLGKFVGKDLDNLLEEALKRNMDGVFYQRPLLRGHFYLEEKDLEKWNSFEESEES